MTERRLVALACRVPLVGEGVASAFDGLAAVERVPAGADTLTVLRWLRPDVLVVDSEEEAQRAIPHARETGLTLVHVLLRERRLRVLKSGRWIEPAEEAVSGDLLCAIVVGESYGRELQP